MLRVGLIGAGNISRAHLFGYNRNSEVEVVAMSDINEELAKQRAETFGVKTVYTDYHDILNDKSIDAVSILTPVFTHKNVVIEALRAGKHVLCEKPPCLSAAEAQECVDVAKEEGKLLMWAFVWLFSKEFNYIKEYIDAGHAGEIYHAEIVSTDPCSTLRSWFVNKELSGGGALIDSTIHLLYPVMHLMGYPKIKSVLGYTNYVNSDLPSKIKGRGIGWISCDSRDYERTVESVESALVVFDNNACLQIKSGHVMFVANSKNGMWLSGDKGGIYFSPSGEIQHIGLVNNYLTESKPVITSDVVMFDQQINHFVDCCLGKAECIVKPEHGVKLMQIIDAVYKSAETGKAVEF